MNIVALIPARAGSKRIPGKNTKLLGGKPLIQWTIEAAQQSGVFSCISVCSDHKDILSVAHELGASPVWRPRHTAMDHSPDIWWVRDVFRRKIDPIDACDAFAILRPTSPFRTAKTIGRAWQQFHLIDHAFDSLRAVEQAKQHPGKMWTEHHGSLRPICPWEIWGEAWHSNPTQNLPRVYVQNSSLEIARRRVVERGTISGRLIAPFFTEGMEGFSLDYPDDWDRAEAYAATLVARVP
jgi:CMP-N,N'-diacetyllegionaminic acid synthase